MATQRGEAVDFTISSDLSRTNFRLLELPEEVLGLLTTAHGPVVLELKSDASSGNAVICSQDKTFPIRSVHTSNSLFVVQPALEPSTNDDDIPTAAIRALASCGATLELTKSSESAVPYLQNALPVYSSRDLNPALAVKSSYYSVARDIPLSSLEIQSSWNSICAFEEQGVSFRPTASILLELWKTIVTASSAENIDLGKAFLFEDLWDAIKDDEFPRGMFDAVLRHVEDKTAMDTNSEENKWSTIDQMQCSAWVASLILETKPTPSHTLNVSEFLDTWRDNLCEKWRDIPNLSLVQNITTQPTSTTIVLKPEHRLSGMPTAVSQAPETTGPSRARKWHEKFKKGRV